MEMNDSEREKVAKENLLRESLEIKGKKIEGYNFDEGVDWNGIVESFGGMGFQASNFSEAMRITNKMIEDKVFIFLGYTSNMVSSGNRDIIRYLVKNKMVDVLVTTAGGIEEDIIKCLGDFVLGDFRADGKELRDIGVNRIGNIFVPNSRYVKFEEFIQPILKELYEMQKKGERISALDLIWKLGEKIGDEKSIYYWAWKNKIKVYCPCITDGAIGDNIYFFNFKNKDFAIDIVRDVKWFNDTTIGLEKSGVLILGSGIVKHSILNANMLRNGADYGIYINTSEEYDGSDSGALPEEAISWGKLKKDCESVKVFGDATILFPFLVAKTFAK